MKKVLTSLTFVLIIITNSNLFAGGVIENSNQSAEYHKTLQRYATTDVDAVHFNPAGTAMMKDGLQFYFSYQYIYQPVEVKSNDNNLNDQTFKGDKTAVFYPNVYAVYKMDKIAFSFGFAPIGGGGDGTFKDGLPSFEHQIAANIGNNLGFGVIDAYTQSTEFKASSAYLSPSFNVAYKLNEMFALSVGYRFIYGFSTYKGTIDNLTLSSVGITVTKATPGFESALADKELDSESKGTAHGFIGGVHLRPIQGLNIGIRYQYFTQLELKNNTKVNTTGLAQFDDGAKSKEQLPMSVAVGVQYEVMPNLNIATSFMYYMNKQADWDGREDNFDNGYEFGLGIDYTLSGMPLNIGIGWLYSKDGKKDEAQSDLSDGLDSHTFGIGATYTVLENLDITVAHSTTYYLHRDVSTTGAYASFEDEYNILSFVFTVGATYRAF